MRTSASELTDQFLILQVEHVIDLVFLVDWLASGSEGVLQGGIEHLILDAGAGIWGPHDEDDLGNFTSVISSPSQVVDDESWGVCCELSSQVIHGGVWASLCTKSDDSVFA